MANKVRDLDRLRVISSCSNNWEHMDGSQTVRYCHQCQKHVHDLSQMTRKQAEELLSRRNGGFCARIVRREDGTLLTKENPSGLQLFQGRLSQVAGAALTTILSVTSAAARPAAYERTPAPTYAGTEQEAQDTFATLKGTVYDPTKAVIVGAKVILINEGTRQPQTTATNDIGVYQFSRLEIGTYSLTVEASGFLSFHQVHITLRPGKELQMDSTLQVDGTPIGLTVSPEKVANLPLPKPNLKEFIGLTGTEEPCNPPKSHRRGWAAIFLLPYKGLKKIFTVESTKAHTK